MEPTISFEEKSIPVKKKLIALEIPETLRQEIRKEAFELDISFSAMIRLILERHYEKDCDTKDAEEGK